MVTTFTPTAAASVAVGSPLLVTTTGARAAPRTPVAAFNLASRAASTFEYTGVTG